MKHTNRAVWLAIPVIIVFVVLGLFIAQEYGSYRAGPTPTPPPSGSPRGDLVYMNENYGFSLTMPHDWFGYTVTDTPIQYGHSVVIRHPAWTQDAPRMDIPVLVYPLTQWEIWEKNNFEGYPTAAPIGPTSRARNNRFVFTTAPRYNFSYLPGWEEVETIVQTIHDSSTSTVRGM